MSRLRASAGRRLRPVLGAAAAGTATVPLGGGHVPLSHPLFQIDDRSLEESLAVKRLARGPARSATWFVPWFRHLAFGGIYTIFRFMSDFAARGMRTRAVIYDNPRVDLDEVRNLVVSTFPDMERVHFGVFDIDADRVEDLPATDAGVCTFWASAYLLLRLNQAPRKYYLIQDYEPFFYPPGPVYALAESTYRFGFEGIVNTPGLYDAVRSRHGVDGVSFVPAVDPRYYFPPSEPRCTDRVRVFFFARPHQERNAFQLGVLAIKILLSRYEGRIELVTAGSEWAEREYGLGGQVTNLGLLGGLQEVGDLYRTCDIGFAYSLTKHPSYQPFEFMASGMATVANRNEDTTWLLQDGVNCLLAEPSPTAMAEKIGRLIDDPALRASISNGGLATVNRRWDKEIGRVWDYMAR